MSAKPKGTMSWKHTVLIVLNVILSLVLVMMLGVTVYVESILHRLDSSDKNKTNNTLTDQQKMDIISATDTEPSGFTGPELDESDVTGPSVDQVQTGEDVISVLLVGQDRRNANYVGQTDSMILCNINKKTGTLTMTSFMRDNYVEIPGYYSHRLNAAYVLGGFELLNETLKTNFGVSADHYIEVDFSAFAEVIDLLGGVAVELNSSEAWYLNRRGNWDVNDASAGTWNLSEGLNYLTGEQALAYCRIRDVGGEYGYNDFGRTGRQRAVLEIVLEEAKTMDIVTMLSIVEKILPLVVTDMSDEDIIRYVRDLAPLLSSLNLENIRIPADGMYTDAKIKGMYVLVPDYEANAQLLREKLGENDE